MRGISFRAAVAWANDVKEFQVNGPAWIDEARYDIVAKAAGPASAEELRPRCGPSSPSAASSSPIAKPRK